MALLPPYKRIWIRYKPFEQAASSNYKLVFGIDLFLRNAAESAVKDHSDINYVIIDDEIKGQNVA